MEILSIEPVKKFDCGREGKDSFNMLNCHCNHVVKRERLAFRATFLALGDCERKHIGKPNGGRF